MLSHHTLLMCELLLLMHHLLLLRCYLVHLLLNGHIHGFHLLYLSRIHVTHALHAHHTMRHLPITPSLHHIQSSLPSDQIRVLLHLSHVHLRVLTMKHGILTTKMGHSHSVLHGIARSRSARIWRHSRGHRTTLSDLRAGHTGVHASHHCRVWLTHVTAMLDLHRMTVSHTWMSRTHRLRGIRTGHHIGEFSVVAHWYVEASVVLGVQ